MRENRSIQHRTQITEHRAQSREHREGRCRVPYTVATWWPPGRHAEQRAQEQANIDKAIADAKASMQVQQLEASLKKDAPAVSKIKAKKLVPAKKTPAKAKGSKSGRVVGISADENIFLKQLLLDIANNTQYNKDEAYNKLIARYNIKN